MAKLDDEFFDEEKWEEEQASREKAVARLGKVNVAVQMLIDGASYELIASELGYGTAEAVAKDIKDELERQLLSDRNLSAEVLRRIQIDRLNTIYEGLKPGIIRGNARSGDIAIKAIDRISKLEGLDAPLKTQSQVEIDINVVSAEIERTKREIAIKRAELESSGIIDATIVEEP